jgi:hypothetical protein
MKNLLALVGLVVVLFCGGGWLLDWYKIVSFTDSEGHYLAAVDVNHGKIRDDVQKARDWISERINSMSSPTSTPATPPKTPTPAPTTSGEPPLPTAQGSNILPPRQKN